MITQTKFYRKYKAEVLFGLEWGLAGGLLFGLAGELLFGLLFGLAWGLLFGLVGGLVGGLAVLLTNFPTAFPFLCNFKSILFLVIGVIIISEIMFWLIKENKPKKKDMFWYTCKRKLESIFEVLLGLSIIGQVYFIFREVKLKNPFPIILKGIGYVGIGIFCLAIIVVLFYLWIKLNEMKYRK